MEKSLRIEKLAEIKKKSTPEMTGIKLMYKGEKVIFEAYKIDLDFLVYNKHNGRIGSLVKSYEKENEIINPETDEGKEIIEEFIWESKKDRNSTTMKSLVEEGQNRFGIVTSDGIIIDGNRRASLLNRIYRDKKNYESKNIDVEKCKYFIAVILPDDAEVREVMRLETTYQMGEDEKLDYNPIEKYLKCKDLEENNFSASEIAKMMSESENTVKTWIEIMKLMDDYLKYVGYEGIYTRLEKKEGQFVDLNRYLKAYERGSCKKVTWGYEEEDISDLTSVSFDYIRADYEGKEFRVIAETSKGSLFNLDEKLWNEFFENHLKATNEISEKTLEELRIEYPEADLSRILKERDEEWKKQIQDKLKYNIKRMSSKLEDIQEGNKPLELLKKAFDTLDAIKTDREEFLTDEEIPAYVKKISSITWEMTKLLRKK